MSEAPEAVTVEETTEPEAPEQVEAEAPAEPTIEEQVAALVDKKADVLFGGIELGYVDVSGIETDPDGTKVATFVLNVRLEDIETISESAE